MIMSDAMPVQFWLENLNTFNETTTQGMFYKCFCQPWNCDDIIRIQFDPEGLDNFSLNLYDEDDVVLQSIPFVNTIGTVYTVSFSPSTYDLCDDTISLKILRGSTIIYKSDCLRIKANWKETVLITYSSNRNFAGIKYSQVTPDPEFYLRIPAVFYHPRHPQEMEVIELSNSQSIQLNAQIKAQRWLKVKDMPPYMHRKTIQVLMHQFVEIDNEEWVKGENYEEIPSNNPRWPLYKATCWLTEKDYILRSVL